MDNHIQYVLNVIMINNLQVEDKVNKLSNSNNNVNNSNKKKE